MGKRIKSRRNDRKFHAGISTVPAELEMHWTGTGVETPGYCREVPAANPLYATYGAGRLMTLLVATNCSTE